MNTMTYSARVAAARANFEALREYVTRLDEKYRTTRANEDYVSLSVRKALRIIGVRADSPTDDVIALIGNGGFDYCLDPSWACQDGQFPPEFACWWGIDQLRSRLDCVYLPKGK